MTTFSGRPKASRATSRGRLFAAGYSRASLAAALSIPKRRTSSSPSTPSDPPGSPERPSAAGGSRGARGSGRRGRSLGWRGRRRGGFGIDLRDSQVCAGPPTAEEEARTLRPRRVSAGGESLPRTAAAGARTGAARAAAARERSPRRDGRSCPLRREREGAQQILVGHRASERGEARPVGRPGIRHGARGGPSGDGAAAPRNEEKTWTGRAHPSERRPRIARAAARSDERRRRTGPPAVSIH